MVINRRPFQGVWNIIQFNWHFYLLAFIVLCLLFAVWCLFPRPIGIVAGTFALLSGMVIFLSLSASYYVYDLSGFYELRWLEDLSRMHILNINAGFDEMSHLIEQKHHKTELKVCDFYNPKKHTELSIKRARRAYPPHPNTIVIKTDDLPFANQTFDKSLAILSVHEIRDSKERSRFLAEMARVTKISGSIVIVEHLRDWRNLVAYTIGAFHFHSKGTWMRSFNEAGLLVKEEKRINLLVSCFVLQHNATTP
jgi:SAM-dependent methyltransferase